MGFAGEIPLGSIRGIAAREKRRVWAGKPVSSWTREEAGQFVFRQRRLLPYAVEELVGPQQ